MDTILISGILFCIGLPVLCGIAFYIHYKVKHKQGIDMGKLERQIAREQKMKELFGYDPNE